MDSRHYFCEIKKHWTLRKVFLNKHSNDKEKFFLETTTLDHSLLFLWAAISLRFFYTCQTAVCSFSVYKLIAWDPANVYLSKVNSINARKKCEMCQKSTKNSRKSIWWRYCQLWTYFVSFSSVSIVDFE